MFVCSKNKPYLRLFAMKINVTIELEYVLKNIKEPISKFDEYDSIPIYPALTSTVANPFELPYE